MKNNLRAVLFHIFIGIVVFAFAFIINYIDVVRDLLYGNFVSRFIVGCIPIILYYNFGKWLNIRESKSMDFLFGNLISLIAFILFLPSLLYYGFGAFNLSVGGSLLRLGFDLFMMPELYILNLFGISNGLINFVISLFIPSIIFGISLKNKRRRLRIRELRRKRR